MTLALIANAVIGLSLLVVILTLLAGAIRRSPVDYRLAIAARRRHLRDQRRASARPASARPRTNWAARPDAF